MGFMAKWFFGVVVGYLSYKHQCVKKYVVLQIKCTVFIEFIITYYHRSIPHINNSPRHWCSSWCSILLKGTLSCNKWKWLSDKNFKYSQQTYYTYDVTYYICIHSSTLYRLKLVVFQILIPIFGNCLLPVFSITTVITESHFQIPAITSIQKILPVLV